MWYNGGMKRVLLSMLVTLCGSSLVWAGTPNKAHDLWTKEKIPFYKAPAADERFEPVRNDVQCLLDVSIPQVVAVPVPKAKKPTPAVVICPGGGYGALAWNLEGVEVAHWLKDHGFAAFILKYRVPNQRPAALADAQRAIRWVRAHAAEYNVDPTAVGIMGFSAGANLTVRAATHFKAPVYPADDAIDRESCRPDFHLPIYPWDLLERKDPENVWAGHKGLTIRAADYPVDKETPPAFLVQSAEDFCCVETTFAYYKALKDAGVEAEAHVFSRGGHGGHGYGVRHHGFPTDAWTALAITWLEQFVK